jgi:hypothetical protein
MAIELCRHHVTHFWRTVPPISIITSAIGIFYYTYNAMPDSSSRSAPDRLLGIVGKHRLVGYQSRTSQKLVTGTGNNDIDRNAITHSGRTLARIRGYYALVSYIPRDNADH